MSPDSIVNQTFLGIPDKSVLLEKLSHDLKLKSEESHLPFGYLHLNINGFAVLTQDHGIDLANNLLIETGEKLRSCVSVDAELFHLEGDEFAIYQTRVASVDRVLFLANKILCSLNRYYSYKKEKFEFSIRIGIVFGSGGYSDANSIMDAGVLACENVDRNHTIGYHVLPATVNQGDKKILSMENDLFHALERQEFELYYQPIMSMKDSKLLGYEALLRWNHPERGLVLPGEFIPIAEKTGIIGIIGEWVLKTACQQAMFWQISGYSSLRLAVNFALIQITQFNIIELVENIIEEMGFDPALLEIELTESSNLSHNELFLSVMEQLTRLGVSFSLDDFGTGFSSISTLASLPIRHIKIDSSFVHDLDEEVNSKPMVKSMIHMANYLNMNIIAEGVETSTQKNFLDLHGVQNYQGNVYSKPLSVKAFTQLLNNVC